MTTTLKYLARKPITVDGTHYGAGDVVDMDRVVPERRKMLLDQRRVIVESGDTPRGRKKTAKKE